MRRKVMPAFALALGITGTVISIVAIVLASCSLGSRRGPSHCRSINE
ncbi:MAG: hypothetical protein ACI4IJ_03725 [Acutalibacteraceae bacterium]|nr:hypothetical protein [Bacillota bacterium]